MNFCTYCNEEIFSIKEHWKTDRHKENVVAEIKTRIEKDKESDGGGKELRSTRNYVRPRYSRVIRDKRTGSKRVYKRW